MFTWPCWEVGRFSEVEAKSQYESRSVTSWLTFSPSNPLMWQVAQVGTGMSLVVNSLGRAFKLKWAFWALNKTTCLDSW